MKKIFSKKYLPYFFLGILFLFHIFFLSYQLTQRAQFTWDQVDNAWNAKNIIVNHEFPLLGMQARQGTGIFMGPFYYYYVALFYLIFNLDPIASPVIALVTGIFTFLGIAFVSWKLFSKKAAFFITLIYTFSFAAKQADRVQWPVAFIPLISAVIFYALYKIISGKEKFVLLLSFFLGFSFNIHFTSVFYIPILLLCLPFYPRTKKFFLYTGMGILIFLLWMSPVIFSVLTDKSGHVNNLLSFANQSSNGLHLRRVMQIAQLAFIEFGSTLSLPFSSLYGFLLPILFCVLFYLKNKSRDSLKLIYLVALWIIIPWLFLATYKGELSDYFFTITRPIAIFSLGYILFWIFDAKGYIGKTVAIAFLLFFTVSNIQTFMLARYQGLSFYENREYQSFKRGDVNSFLYGAPESYLYYFYQRKYHQL